MEAAYQHLARVQAERAQSEAAVRLLQRWADGLAPDASGPPLHSGAAARRLGVTVDMLRNWERNNLLEVPRNPANGYRLYGGPELSRLRIIRMLSRAGYSTMAILRMLLVFDRGQGAGLRQALDTPRPDEDAFSAADRWLSTLAEEEARAEKMIALLEEMIHKQA
jgi:DNA-binding transcriptional MerR regulator